MKLPGNMQAMMKQAEQMQKKMQEEIALIRVEPRPAAAWSRWAWTARRMVTAVKIDPEVAGDVEMLQDMVMAAFNEASKKVDEATQEKMGGLLGGLGLAAGDVLEARCPISPNRSRA
jgi:DNA-binding YbaB/EbfC family protein